MIAWIARGARYTPNVNDAESRESRTGSERGLRVRCVALLPIDRAELPRDLREELDRRGFDVQESTDAYDAMARLVLLERDRRLSPDSHAGIVLLVVEPGSIARGDELRGSASRFVPGLVCWRYESSATPRLARWSESQPEQIERPAPAVAKPTSKPTLRLTEPSLGPDPLDTSPAAAAARDKDEHEEPGALSEEELAMLLGESEVSP